MRTEVKGRQLNDAAVVCRTCGSTEILVVDTSKTRKGNYHGAVCRNGHALLLLTTLVRMAKSPRVRRRFPPDLGAGDDSDKGLSGR